MESLLRFSLIIDVELWKPSSRVRTGSERLAVKKSVNVGLWGTFGYIYSIAR